MSDLSSAHRSETTGLVTASDGFSARKCEMKGSSPQSIAFDFVDSRPVPERLESYGPHTVGMTMPIPPKSLVPQYLLQFLDQRRFP
jgi:hypothetical protein